MLMQNTFSTQSSRFDSMRRLSATLLVVCVVTMLTSAVAADAITLRHSTRLSDDATSVRLSDVAKLEGSHAEQFASLELAPLHPQARPIELSVDLIRQKLTDAGAHWGKLNLTGRSVTVRPSRAQARGTQLLAMQAVDVSTGEVKVADAATSTLETNVSVEVATVQEPKVDRVGATASDLILENTVRGILARRCAQTLGLSPSDIRLEFANDDRLWVSAERPADSIEIHLDGRWTSDRLGVEVTIWAGKESTESLFTNK